MFEPADLASRERVEQLRRSVVMLTPGQWALKRDDAELVLQALRDALDQLRRERRHHDRHHHRGDDDDQQQGVRPSAP